MKTIDEDMHVHSTFSDGRHSAFEVLRSARARGIKRLGFADHVRRDSDWLPTYVHCLRRMRAHTETEIVIGVEAKLLDGLGTLDVPDAREGVERILAADHRLPWHGQLLGPRQVREAMGAGLLSAAEVHETLLAAYEGCARRYQGVQLAHPLSLLARVGVPEADIPRWRLRRFAAVLAEAGAVVEVSERWKCPTRETLKILAEEGVTIVASTDAHDAGMVGRYDYVREATRGLAWRA